LDEFSSVDNLLKNTHQLKGALQKKVIENEEQIRLSYSLATIFTEVPLDFNLDDFAIKSINKEKLTSIYQELEFKNLIDKLNGVSAKTKKVKNENATMLSLFDTSENVEKIDQTIDFQSSLETIRSVQHTYHIVQTEKELQDLTNLLLSSDEFCFDTETTSVVSLDAELVGMSFAVVEHEAYYLPFPKEFSEVKLLLDKIKEPFLNSSIRKIGQNMKYDISVLKNYDFEVCGELFDTMIAHYLLNPELYHNMDYMAETILNYSTIRINEIAVLEGKGKNKELNMRAVELQKIADYAAEDADITLQLKNRLAPRLKENKMEELFHSIEMPLVRVLVEMERNGVVVDEFSLQQVSGKMTQYLLSVEQQVRSFSSKPLNVSSPKQIGEFLFDELKLDAKARKTKSGQYVTDEETLEALKNKHEVVPLILEYRGLKKLLSTYIDVLPTLIHRRTGRVHTSFNQTVTATGRLSSSNPNLQNIPIRDEKGKEIRRAFVADQGCKMLGADYSQIELRIMAHLSQDQNLINAFNADQDIHAVTASKIFRVPINEVTSDMRRKAKTANFGIIYGISAFGLANRLGISRTEAKQLIDDYFLSFPKVKEYMDNVIEQARKNGYVLTICNRKRYLPDINSHNANVRGFAERNAINAPIQGSSADIIKIAMIRILSRIKSENLKSQMILQIHDELQFNVPNEEVDRLRTIVSEEMSSAIQLLVPLKVDIEIGNNWLETH
jgi:DNA polymerase-1